MAVATKASGAAAVFKGSAVDGGAMRNLANAQQMLENSRQENSYCSSFAKASARLAKSKAKRGSARMAVRACNECRANRCTAVEKLTVFITPPLAFLVRAPVACWSAKNSSSAESLSTRRRLSRLEFWRPVSEVPFFGLYGLLLLVGLRPFVLGLRVVLGALDVSVSLTKRGRHLPEGATTTGGGRKAQQPPILSRTVTATTRRENKTYFILFNQWSRRKSRP